MKRIITIISACAMLAASCENKINFPEENKNPENMNGIIPVSLHVNGAATKSSSTNQSEDQINNLQVFVYTVDSDGTKAYDSYYEFASDETRIIYIDPNNGAESYWIAAYANSPKIEIADPLKDWSLFANESAGSFQMAGQCDKSSAEILEDKKVEIELIRQCSKVTVENISLKWTNPANRYKSFKLKGMYLMDVPGVFENYFPLDAQIAADGSLWQNPNGFTSGPQDALLYTSIDGVSVTEEKPYTADHILYGYLSPKTEYNETAEWKPLGTRLVIEAEFNGNDCYYAVVLNGINGDTVHEDLRNKHIVFNDITITKPGSDTPYGTLADEDPVSVSVSVQPWQSGFSGNYIIK